MVYWVFYYKNIIDILCPVKINIPYFKKKVKVLIKN